MRSENSEGGFLIMKNNSKRNGMFCALAVAALLLGGCAQGQGKMAYIGADAAKKQILAEVGLDESQVKINSVDMATKNGMDYYRVEFSDADGNVYRYDIEALTGKVIESDDRNDSSSDTGDGHGKCRRSQFTADRTADANRAAAVADIRRVRRHKANRGRSEDESSGPRRTFRR